MRVRIAAVIAAAGSSQRMGGLKKEYRPLPTHGSVCPAGKSLTVLGSAVSAFAASPRIELIVIAVPEGGEREAREAMPQELFQKNRGLLARVSAGGSILPSTARRGPAILFVSGGPDRQVTVRNALCRLEQYSPSHVLIHDGARPWISVPLIERVIDAVLAHNAVIPLLPLVETPKEVDFSDSGTGFISRHLRRSALGTAQTPQAFLFPEILGAHRKAAAQEEARTGDRKKNGYTDDAEVWGEFVGKVAVIPGDPKNRKITFPEDLA